MQTALLPEADKLVPIREAGSLLPGHPCVQTMYDWIKGLGGVRLNTVVIGGRRYVTAAQIEEFIKKRSTMEPQPRRRPTASSQRQPSVKK